MASSTTSFSDLNEVLDDATITNATGIEADTGTPDAVYGDNAYGTGAGPGAIKRKLDGSVRHAL